jgi:hypothetical protein
MALLGCLDFPLTQPLGEVPSITNCPLWKDRDVTIWVNIQWLGWRGTNLCANINCADQWSGCAHPCKHKACPQAHTLSIPHSVSQSACEIIILILWPNSFIMPYLFWHIGNPFWRERLSTVDLLIKIGSFLKKKNSLSVKSSWADTSPSARIPCLVSCM